jgi:hypothetical protein
VGRSKSSRESAQARRLVREAATVFLDVHARIFDDPDSGGAEIRFLLVGLSAARRTLVVVHVERGEYLRIISAREATRRERRNLYER